MEIWEARALFFRRNKTGEDSGIISPEELKAQLASASAPLVLDVREKFEWDQGHIPGAMHIPLGSLAERAGKLPKDREIVCVCQSGARSGHATRWLRQSGYRAKNLRGGYLRWSGPMEGGRRR